MAHYFRMTAASVEDALRIAERVLPDRIPTEKTAADDHSVTFSGGDGTVTITAHRHGMETEVEAETDQLRTSRLDLETQYFLNQLPYQPEDVLTE